MSTRSERLSIRMSLLIALAVGAAAGITGCATGKNGDTPAELYKSVEARKTAFESYDRAMELWSVSYEEDWVETEYGTTHIIVAGPEGAPAVFFLPGLFGDATMWYANVGPVAEHYRVYCPDLLTFGGKGRPSETAIEDAGDYASWFGALMEHYGCNTASVAGLSYGSWLSLALAREMPERIDAVIMLDPSETFMKMDGGIAWKGFWSFMVFPNRAKYADFFDWLGGGYTDPQVEVWFEHMLDVIEYGTVGMFDVPQHRIYAPEELCMVTMPVLIMAGGKPILYKDPQEFAEAAAEALPHAEIVIVPGTGHSLNVQKADDINAEMLRFLAAAHG